MTDDPITPTSEEQPAEPLAEPFTPDPEPAANPDADTGESTDQGNEHVDEQASEAEPVEAPFDPVADPESTEGRDRSELPDDVRARILADNAATAARNANVNDRDGATRAQQQRVIDAERLEKAEAELAAAKGG